MSALWILIKKNLKLLLIKRSNILAFLYPVILIVAIMKVTDMSSTGLKIGILDNDNTISSQVALSSLESNKSFSIITLKSSSDIKEKIIENDLNMAITIPEGFEKSILKGEGKEIEVTSSKGSNIQDFTKTLINFQVKNLNDIGKASLGDESKFNEMVKNYKESDSTVKTESIKDVGRAYSITQYSVGILIFFLLVRALAVSSLIKKERDENTYARIFMTPVSSIQYLGANVIANMIILVIQIIIVQLSLKYIIKLETGVGFISMFLLLVLISLVAVAIGTFCIAMFKDEQAINTFMNLGITATCMISGCFIPIEMLPKKVQDFAFFTPQRWVGDAISKMQMGNSLLDVWLNIVVLLAFALTFFLIASYKVKVSRKEIN